MSDRLVTVVDSVCGSGKTMNARAKMKADGPDVRTMFVSPYLDEVANTVTAVPWFRSPDPVKGRKLEGLKQLLSQGECISTTHALFLRLDDECRALIAAGGYSLVMDETVSPVEELTVNRRDWEAIIDGEAPLVKEHDGGLVEWCGGADYGGTDEDPAQFEELKAACDGGTVSITSKDDRKVWMAWTLSFDSFACFSAVTIMTYLFESGYLRGFLSRNGCRFEYDHSLDGRSEEIMAELRGLISLYNGRYNNSLFDERTALSHAWFKRRSNAPAVTALSNAVRGFLEYRCGARRGTVLWTTFLSAKDRVGGRRFGDGFLPCNARATNDYRDRTAVVYACNRFFNPNLRRAFGCDAATDDDYALGEIVQFVFRSAVRMGEKIELYVPSGRMREIFRKWLEGR